MKLSTKVNICASLGSTVLIPALVVHQFLPGEDAKMIAWYLFISIPAWLAAGAAIFAINWIVFGALYLFGRWIWESFYKSPIG